ncbi:MAG: type II toxin-antitoxin system VapC family toxin [Rubrobacter sp.]|nr:type II toxin-antitoxin system VapC family toxin [Rubrobacter sp.]MBA3791650.1 type II toxin-antitoxin system VapC family toxin [Rubrobacter sp.]
MSEKRAKSLVLDTSVALKFYLPEEGHEEALGLLEAAEAGAAELLAPGTLLPEGFNAIAQQRRRGLLDEEDATGAWAKLLAAPVYTYAVEDLIERAATIANETGAIIYDALFLALAEDTDTVMVTADGKLLQALKSTRHASLARPLEQISNLIQ